MTFDEQCPQTPLTFDIWRVKLRKDCAVQGKRRNFDSMGEYPLRLLWEEGIDPSVQAISGNVCNSQDMM